MLTGVGKRKVSSARSRLLKERFNLTMKNQVGRATLVGRDFSILPPNSSSPTGLESFKRRLFCCEARGVMLCGADTAGIAIGALG